MSRIMRFVLPVLLIANSLVGAAPLPYERKTPVVDVVSKVMPSVLAIKSDVKRTVFLNPMEMFGIPFSGPVREKVFSSAGSGVIVGSDGVVLTNAHVVQDANRLTGTTTDGTVYNLTMLGVDRDFDIAVLQIEPQNNAQLPQFSDVDWGTSSDLMIGETAVVIGSGLNFENSVSVGVISGLERTIQSPRLATPYFGMIQTDAAINRGNSGGPLVNIKGEIIGISTLIASEGGGSDGIGFAIPIERARQVYNEFVHGWVSLEERLGIQYVSAYRVENIDPGQVERLQLKENTIQGLLVRKLDTGALAAQAGMAEGDLIIRVKNQEISQLKDFRRILEEHPSDQDLSFEVFRVDLQTEEVRSLSIRIPAWNLAQIDRIEHVDSWFGFRVQGITNDIADHIGVSIDDGVVIAQIQNNSPAQNSGLEPGDIIVAVNQVAIKTIGDFRRIRHALQNEKAVEFSVRRGKALGTVKLQGE